MAGELRADQYAVDWSAVAGGGIMSANVDSYSVSGTIGQAAAGVVSDHCMLSQGGFWVVTLTDSAVISAGTTIDLSVATTDSADPILVGSNLVYTIEIANSGAATATGIVVTNILPPSVSFISAASAHGICTGTGPVICNLEPIVGGGCAQITIVVIPTAPGFLTNTTSIAANEEDSQPLNNSSAQVTTAVSAAPRSFLWTGAFSSDWFNPINWTPAGVPGMGDSATVNGGTVDLSGSTNVAHFNLNGATLSGSGDLYVTVGCDWTSGVMQGLGSTTIAAGGTMNISGNNAKVLLSRTLNNAGMLIWSGTGGLTGHSGPTINNLAGALFDMQSDAALNRFDNGAVINNAGIFRKSGGTATKTLDLYGGLFNNTGLLEVQSGSISFAGPLNHSGTTRLSPNTYIWFGENSTNSGLFYLATNSSVYFAVGNHRLNAGTLFTGDGFARVASGTVLVNGPVSAQNFEMDGANGILDGPNTLTISSVFNWTGGTMQGSGITTIAAGGVMNLSGSNGKTLLSRTLKNAGTINWSGTGGLTGHSGPTINNLAGALFDMQSDAMLSSFNQPATINNAGTFRKSGGSGVKTIDGFFNNTGLLDLRSGILSLTREYAPAASSGLNIVLGGTTVGTQFSQLQIGGVATLNGTLNLIRTNGFSPAANNSFQIVSYGSRAGSFSTVTGQNAGNGLTFVPVYQSAGLLLVIQSSSYFDPAQLSLLNGQFHLRLGGVAGHTFVIQASTNLTNWESISTNTFSGSTLDFIDSAAMDYPYRFYRAILNP